jgi:protoporphyrinogen oxidase
MYKYLIIGGGITGITLGRMLQKAGVEDFIILESEKEAGGLCKTREIDGHVLDIGGAYFLWPGSFFC